MKALKKTWITFYKYVVKKVVACDDFAPVNTTQFSTNKKCYNIEDEKTIKLP